MRNWRRASLCIALAGMALILAGCGGPEERALGLVITDEEEIVRRVWVINVVELGASFVEIQDLESGEAEVTFEFRLESCLPEAKAFAGGLYRHSACKDEPIGLDPDDVRELTATATVWIDAEVEAGLDLPRRLARVSTQIGPIAFGASVTLPPVVHSFPIGDLGRVAGYYFTAYVRECRLSNGSTCGNDSLRLPLQFGGIQPTAPATREDQGEAADAAEPDEAEPGGRERPSLESSSTWRVTISNVQSTCGPEPAYSEDIVIERNGAELRVEGLGDPGEQWIGIIQGDILRFGGDRLEGQGVTTTIFDLLIDRSTEPWTLMGTEAWTHSNRQNGTADVSGTKIS